MLQSQPREAAEHTNAPILISAQVPLFSSSVSKEK